MFPQQQYFQCVTSFSGTTDSVITHLPLYATILIYLGFFKSEAVKITHVPTKRLLAFCGR